MECRYLPGDLRLQGALRPDILTRMEALLDLPLRYHTKEQGGIPTEEANERCLWVALSAFYP